MPGDDDGLDDEFEDHVNDDFMKITDASGTQFVRGGSRQHPLNNPCYFIFHHVNCCARHIILVVSATAANIVPL